MLVETILQNKGTTVYTLPETGTLNDAVSMLNAHNIGAIVITGESGDIVGILSERDIVRQLGRDPGTALTRTIASCMTRTVVICERSTAIDDVMERMTRRRIRHIPVVESTRLIGIVSIGDVVKRKIEQIEGEAEAMREYIAG